MKTIGQFAFDFHCAATPPAFFTISMTREKFRSAQLEALQIRLAFPSIAPLSLLWVHTHEIIMRLDDEERNALLDGQDIKQVSGHAMRGFDDIGERLLQV
jgi:hypothetical protein